MQGSDPLREGVVGTLLLPASTKRRLLSCIKRKGKMKIELSIRRLLALESMLRS